MEHPLDARIGSLQKILHSPITEADSDTRYHIAEVLVVLTLIKEKKSPLSEVEDLIISVDSLISQSGIEGIIDSDEAHQGDDHQQTQ